MIKEYSRWLIILLALIVILLAHGIYSMLGASRAREALLEASDSIATLVDARAPLEMRSDSLHTLVKKQQEELKSASARWARELVEANERAERANVRASTLVDSIRVRVDSTTLELVDSLVVEHDNEITALGSQITIFKLENIALRNTNLSLSGLVEIADDLEANLRAELQQQSQSISDLERLVSPSFSLRFLRSAKVGIPMAAVGVALGFLFSN